MTRVPSNRESLYPYTRYEQQAIAALRRRQWVAPKNNNPSGHLFPGILSTPTSLPTPKAILERVRRTNPSVEPIPKVQALKAPDRPPVETLDHQAFSEVTFTTMTTFKNKGDDEYSDDLYGTGRPVRPYRINPEKTVEHWQLSAHGNPEVTGKLENTFAPAINGLGVKKDQPHQADGIGVLIPLNDIPVSTDVEEYGIQEATVRGSGISILAELNLVFAGSQECSLEAPVEYGCISDDVTDVESEDEKIEDLETHLGNSECTKVAMNEEEYRMMEPQELGKRFEITEDQLLEMAFQQNEQPMIGEEEVYGVCVLPPGSMEKVADDAFGQAEEECGLSVTDMAEEMVDELDGSDRSNNSTPQQLFHYRLTVSS